jgi:hypothetical protein
MWHSIRFDTTGIGIFMFALTDLEQSANSHGSCSSYLQKHTVMRIGDPGRHFKGFKGSYSTQRSQRSQRALILLGSGVPVDPTLSVLVLGMGMDDLRGNEHWRILLWNRACQSFSPYRKQATSSAILETSRFLYFETQNKERPNRPDWLQLKENYRKSWTSRSHK